MSACEIRVLIRHVTRVQQVATLRYYRRLTPSSRDPPIWLRFMFPSVPGLGSRIWMICVRAFGWLTETHHAAMSCVDCSVEGIQAGERP
jgi:hypothetical protein